MEPPASPKRWSHLHGQGHRSRPKGEQEDPEIPPPPSCHTVAHPVSQLSPSLQLGGVGGLAQCWGHRCEHSEKRDLFMWAAMLGLELSP